MKEIFATYGISISDEQIQMLEKYYQLLLEWNKKVNLTSITEYEDVVWKHFIDSSLIMLSEEWKKSSNVSVLDVGTGAGFPGMVLAILNPEKKFTLLDSLNKRIGFLNVVIKELSLENVTAFHGRAETFGRMENFRSQFDFVLSRAVAELPVLIEYCVPFAKKNGFFISYKGKKQKEEIAIAKHAFEELGVSFDHSQEFTLKNGEKRCLLFIQVKEETREKYPRKEGKPKKSPL